MVMRVASFFPFQATYYLNGHSFIEQELNRNKIGFRKNDNACPAVLGHLTCECADDLPCLFAGSLRLIRANPFKVTVSRLGSPYTG
jgi:hypothetical protein